MKLTELNIKGVFNCIAVKQKTFIFLTHSIYEKKLYFPHFLFVDSSIH